MTYDYFYGQQAEMFAFYRVPKVLFTEDCFWNVSTDAKLLYGILLDRMNLSARNGWLDEEGRVYIIFTIEEIKGALGCAEKKAVKLLDELEKKCGLIERKRQGLGKPNLIYVKNFISGSVERQFLNCQKDNSGVVKNTIQELSKAQGNNTDTNYIDFSDTDPFFPSGFCGKEVDETDEFTRYYQYFYEQLSMDYLKQDYPYDHEILDLILHLIIEVMCSNRKQIRIASDDKPIEIVKSSFMKLDSEHIRFVMSSFKENTTDVRNIKQYLLASIYNAPYTIKIMGKDLNRALRDGDGEIYDIIAGDFLVVGLGEEDFSSLSPELMKQFEEHFHQPETFVRMGRSIMALPLPDDMVKKEDAPIKADPTPRKSSPDRDAL